MSKNDYKDQVVWIIGASSGIGAALACELSKRGAILALSGRRKTELEKLKNQLGDRHKIFPLDVSDTSAVSHTAQIIRSSFSQLNKVVFLAASYTPMKIDALDIVNTKQMVDTNLTGAFNVVHAALPVLRAQQNKGQIALCASIAGFIGLPGGQPYSATKAGVISLAESLHAECKNYIDVKLINPGFVRTSLTDKNNFHMPLMIEPEQAANEIADGLLSKRFEIHFPKGFTWLLKILRALPYGLSLKLLQKIKI